MRILRDLEAGFLEVRILKSSEEKTKRARTRGAEAPHLRNPKTQVQKTNLGHPLCCFDLRVTKSLPARERLIWAARLCWAPKLALAVALDWALSND